MSYIEKIKKNVQNAIEIKKEAIKNGVDYTTAKIMYHNGAKDISLDTAQIIKNNINPTPYMLDTFDSLFDYLSDRGINETALNLSINDKIKRKYIKELSDYINADFLYGNAIANLIRKGLTLKSATLLFEARMKFEMTINDLSEIAALAKILFFKNNMKARYFEKAYLNGRAQKHYPFSTVKNEILLDEKYKKKNINGIIILSKNEEGLKKLENIVTEALKNGNQDFKETLIAQQSEKNKLIVSDVDISSTNTSYYNSGLKFIHMDNKCLNNLNYGVTVFYHEVSHYLDNINGKENFSSSYSIENPNVKLILMKIAKKINPINRGLSLQFLRNYNARKYANNPELNQKWMNEIYEKFPDLSKKNYEILMKQKIITERKRFKIFYSSLTDIYDSMTNGKLRDNFGVSGHGSKYYKYKNNVLLEFIANIGRIYNANATDILRYEFGDETAEQIIDLYQNIINNVDSNQMTR